MKMDSANFEITFVFRRQHYKAAVSVLRQSDHIQYTVTPKDEKLMTEFATQVFHHFRGKLLQAAFPGETVDKRAFTAAMTKGLEHYLETNS